jgi:hypothetical protein
MRGGGERAADKRFELLLLQWREVVVVPAGGPIERQAAVVDETMQLSGVPPGHPGLTGGTVSSAAAWPQKEHRWMRWTVTLVAEVEPGQRVEHEIVAVDRDAGSPPPRWD